MLRFNFAPLLTASGLCKVLDEFGQLLRSLKGNGIVVASPDAAYTAVTLEPGEAKAGGLLEECLFGLVDISILRDWLDLPLAKK